ncbi:MAG: alpha/beta hydrolase fold domain-containing protein [Pirellulaceae bacterium]|nr:alpha/beta hydrolase fold domain-containing protein [Pirellulaceae bacterium]
MRSHAATWEIDPERIGILGFSAGGHLAVMTATSFDRRLYARLPADPARRRCAGRLHPHSTGHGPHVSGTRQR